MMHASAYHFLPFSLLFYAVLVGLFILVVVLVEVGLVSYTAHRLGIERQYVFVLLLLCLVGSYINIPVAQFPPEKVESGRIVTFYGVQYVVPVVHQWPGTVLAVNVGGALIPVGLAIYLVIKHRLYVPSLIGVVAVTLVVHALARPVRGVGISVPFFLPPIAAALIALALSRHHPYRNQSAPLAYVSGTLGTLIGADLLNLGWLPGLGAPVASIGGAGTFDGVFLTGLVAVLLA
jgi:uncharacterized membrane protein